MSEVTAGPFGSIANGLRKRSASITSSGSGSSYGFSSRSPSPPSRDVVPGNDPDGLAEWMDGGGRNEAVRTTIDTALDEANLGMRMLMKMGWSKGVGLGVDGRGRVDPIPINHKMDFMGVGKATLDNKMLGSVTLKARELESEKIAKESEHDKLKREEKVAQKAAVAQEIAETLRAFYCEICDKGYQNVGQFNEHLNSYDHHHRKRFKEMQQQQRASAASAGEVGRRREKERKREEKELKRLGLAAGVTLGGIMGSSSSSSSAPKPDAPKPSAGFKKAGGFSKATPSSSNPSSSASQLPSATPASSLTNPTTCGAPAFRSAGLSKLGLTTTPSGSYTDHHDNMVLDDPHPAVPSSTTAAPVPAQGGFKPFSSVGGGAKSAFKPFGSKSTPSAPSQQSNNTSTSAQSPAPALTTSSNPSSSGVGIDQNPAAAAAGNRAYKPLRPSRVPGFLPPSSTSNASPQRPAQRESDKVSAMDLDVEGMLDAPVAPRGSGSGGRWGGGGSGRSGIGGGSVGGGSGYSGGFRRS